MSELQKQNDFPEIILSNIQYKLKFKDFKEYAKKKWIDKNKLLSDIQDKMWLNKSEKWYFWPKTISYLESQIYTQESTNDALEFSKTSEWEEIKNEYQEKLDNYNDDTYNLIDKNIKKSWSTIKDIVKGSLKISYNKITRESSSNVTKTKVIWNINTEKWYFEYPASAAISPTNTQTVYPATATPSAMGIIPPTIADV